jgi:hypothetical protein
MGTPLTPQGALRSRQALRHHANAILREDSRGARLAKETKGRARGASTARWPPSWPSTAPPS